MRITNTMMTNTTMRNVNKSKNNLYTTEQQMSSQKKISKPSDDPIIAIRALSLRTSLTEVEQYLKKNVPDAGAWLTLTETSLNNMDGIYKDIIKYCTQGSTDSYETEYTAVERCDVCRGKCGQLRKIYLYRIQNGQSTHLPERCRGGRSVLQD